MASVVQQLYSQTHFGPPFDGVQTTWNFNFSGGYILPGHVRAYYLDAAGARVELSLVESQLIGEFQLKIDTPPIPATAQRLVIYRNTPKDLPLVNFEDGANVSEPNLDRITKQAVFCAAEVLDGTGLLDLLDYGYKNLRRTTYTGASTVNIGDSGRAHYKADGTPVAVPNTLPADFLVTVINNSNSAMTLTMAEDTYIQDGSGTPYRSLLIAKRGNATLAKVSTNQWFIAGPVTGVS